MKKLVTLTSAGFAFFFCVFAFSYAFAAETTPSTLYGDAYVQDVLTARQPTPWNIVRHYVGDNSKLIALILTEQGVSLDSRAKFPVGMTVRVPQKYVKKELLPSPSAAEKLIADVEHRVELQNQAGLFRRNLEAKDRQIVGHWFFDALLIVAIIFLIRFHTKTVKRYDNDMDFVISDHRSAYKNLGEANEQIRVLQKDLATKKTWTPDEIKDALMGLTLRETRDLLEWEVITVQREGGGESKTKLKNLPDFLKNKDENLFDVPLRLMSDHKVASAPTEKSA
jgi:hypothetical protein